MTLSSEAFPFTPVVIIGAGRSGTNVLRDALTRLKPLGTWPCDEINPIWRHGNLDWPNDEIPPCRATPEVQRSVRRAFQRVWRQLDRPDFVVEKTCANTLRVPFVDLVLPEAKYINIVRNGFDIVSSAQKRWRGELEVPTLSYYLAKARYSPVFDLPHYALAALGNRLAIKLGRKKHFNSWGPRFSGLELLADAPLDEIVARQWAASINASDAAFEQIESSRVLKLHYEDFTNDPVGNLRRITDWLGIKSTEEAIRSAVASVRTTSVGKGKAISSSLSSTTIAVLEGPMRAHGYLEEL